MVDYDKLPKRNIIVIDMKSFFATCECVERGLDPYKTALVVAEPGRNGAMTLAVTPYMKALGVASRTRIYQIPDNIKYKVVPPRMNTYVKYSQMVVGVYREFVSPEDIHVYSIDECFLDVTDYLHLHKVDDYSLAKRIMDRVKEKTGLISTAGIGPNMLIAKVAMDIEAKHTPDNIAKWSYKDIERKFWPITPLSEFWGIGKRMQKNLNEMGIYSIGDLAHYDIKRLKSKFGIMGEEMWNHANGIDLARISEYNEHIPKDHSFGHSQVLFKDYFEDNIVIIIREMIEVLTSRLRKHRKKCNVVGFGVGYSKTYGGGFYHSRRLPSATTSEEDILNVCIMILSKCYEGYPIRKVSISLGGLENNNNEQLNLFESVIEKEKRENINETIDDIRTKYGKNALIKASNLLADSTMIERNKKRGGHRE